MKTSREAFTLIELMVVVIIIAALAAMVMPRLIPASDEAKKNIAKGDMANISVALKLFRLHQGVYPSNIDELMGGSGSTSYLERQPLDPWKVKYNYSFLSEDGTPPFELTSSGPDKRKGTGDDVNFWD